jgi:hypothetical protein
MGIFIAIWGLSGRATGAWFALASLALLTASTAAGQSGLLRGRVLDAEAQASLPAVTIWLQGTAYGATTDQDGGFSLEVPAPQTYTLRFTMVGYKEQVLTDVSVPADAVLTVDVTLHPDITRLDAVEVEAPTTSHLFDGFRLDAQAVADRSDTVADPLAVLLTEPGVSTSRNYRSGLIIRGAGPNENLYLVDGIEVPHLYHFPFHGTAGGTHSILNPDLVEELTLVPGSLPAAQGNALSGLVQVRSRTDSTRRPLGAAALSLGSVDAALSGQGSLPAGGSWGASVRRSYLGWTLARLGHPIRPNYWDFQTRLSLRPAKGHTLSLVGLGALDRFHVRYEEDRSQAGRPHSLQAHQGYTLGLRWQAFTRHRLLTATLSRSASRFDFREYSRSRTLLHRYDGLEAQHRLHLSSEWMRGELSGGGGLTLTQVHLENELEAHSPLGGPSDRSQDVRSRLHFAQPGAFAWLRVKGQALAVEAGLRLDAHTLLRTAVLSPRLQVGWQGSESWSLHLAASRNTQAPEAFWLSARGPEGALVNAGLPYLRAPQASLGVRYAPPSGRLRAGLGVFHKRYQGYPVLARLPQVTLAHRFQGFSPSVPEALQGGGRGRAQGVEVEVEASSARLRLGGAYTLSWSTFAGATGAWAPSAVDARHNVQVNVRLQVGGGTAVFVRGQALSGQPYTPFDVARSAAEYALRGISALDYGRLNAARLPSFQRLDVRLEHRLGGGTWGATVYGEVQNVTNHRNVLGYSYHPEAAVPEEGIPHTNPGVLPLLGLRLNW